MRGYISVYVPLTKKSPCTGDSKPTPDLPPGLTRFQKQKKTRQCGPPFSYILAGAGMLKNPLRTSEPILGERKQHGSKGQIQYKQ